MTSFVEFIGETLNNSNSGEYIYIARYNKEIPSWHVFIATDGENGKRLFSGDYQMRYIDMEELVNVFSCCANNNIKIVVDNNYFID